MPKPKIKAEELGSMKEFSKSLKRGNTQYLTRISEDGMNVRFLTEPEQWVKYREHYDENHEPRYFPCVEGVCEGCQTIVDSPSKRYLANALDLDTKEVVPLVIPVSLAQVLEARYSKHATIMDRDYELSRTGTGFDTKYDAYNEGPSKMALKKYTLLNLLDILAGQLEQDDDSDVDDDDDIDDDIAKPTRRRDLGARRSRDADDDDVARPKKKAAPKKRVAKKAPAKKAVAKKGLAKRRLSK